MERLNFFCGEVGFWVATVISPQELWEPVGVGASGESWLEGNELTFAFSRKIPDARDDFFQSAY
jgi:hypothetical protein